MVKDEEIFGVVIACQDDLCKCDYLPFIKYACEKGDEHRKEVYVRLFCKVKMSNNYLNTWFVVNPKNIFIKKEDIDVIDSGLI